MSLVTSLLPFEKRVIVPPRNIVVSRPIHLLNSPQRQKELRTLYDKDPTMNLVDYRGTTIAGKRSTSLKQDNPTFDPITGASRSNKLYDPDFQLLQERLEFVKNSKTLSIQQRDFIERFVNNAVDLGVNKQTAIAENLRIILERYNKDRKPWDNFEAVVRNEIRYSVVNTSRLLDRRSRRATQYWLKFGQEETPGVYIDDTFYSLNDLHRLQKVHNIERTDWERTVARREGRRLLNRGRTPVFTYLIDPVRAPTPRALKKKIKDSLDKLKLLPDKIFNSRPIFRQYVRANVSEFVDIKGKFEKFKRRVRDFFNVERRLTQVKNTSSLELATLAAGGRENPKLERVYAGAVQSVASGLQTDYDGLSITVGRNLYQNYFKDLTAEPATLKTYHRVGSLFLDDMVKRKMIRVNSRGIVRRSIRDLETGRYSNAWKDTVSKEIELIDKRFKRYSRLQKLDYMSRQIGTVNDAGRVVAKIGNKDYFDTQGRKTNIWLTTRDAYERFNKNQVDRDIVNMLNHANNVQWTVDPEHADFMYRLFTFRDPRGRTEYFDSINGFRAEVVRRGAVGYGTLQTVKLYGSNGKKFSNSARIDSRGRLYYRGFLSPTQGEVIRPFIDSADSRILTKEGYTSIKGSIGALLGDANQKLDYVERLKVFEKNKKDLVDVGRIMSQKTQRDRRIRDFLEHPLIKNIDPEEVNKLARLALEVYRIESHVGRQPYKTKLNIEVDASASGLQMISLVTGDKI